MAGQTPSVGMSRKLAAIFSTDVAGYSRLMGDDEEATIRTLTAYREVISSLIQHHRGRVVDAPGDNLLAEFASVVDAVRCAVEIQQELKAKNAELPEPRQMRFRVGINLGDVIVEGERLYGDGVNIAARLESLAEPGGICISSTVHDHVKNKLALSYEDLGEQVVKNIADPVRVYRVSEAIPSPLVGELVLRVVGGGQGGGTVRKAESAKFQVHGSKSKDRRAGLARQKWTIVVGTGLLLMVGTIVAVRYLSSPAPSIQRLAPSTQATPAALALPDKPSIIVLPFVNMSKEPEQEYFSDGLTETLTGNLSRLSGLFVIARNTAFTYKGKAANVQEVGKELGVRYVLEGSVQRAGQQVRITAQLIDATRGYHLWSEQYDRPLKDVFALQDEIVQKIVTTLRLQLTVQEQGIIVRKSTDNLEAYDSFLRGMEYYWRLTQKANIQARQMFEKAVALDPQYAEATALLGATYWAEWGFRWSADPQVLERALTLAQQAVALNDSLPAGHVLLSHVYYLQQQYDQAVAEGERAIALEPNNADSYASQADVLNFAGRPEEALRMMEQAMRLNPRYPPQYLWGLGFAYRFTGRYAEAITTLKETLSRNPNFPPVQLNLVISYWLQWLSQQSPATQTLEPALVAAQQALPLNDSWFLNRIGLGWIYLYQRQFDKALAEMERAVVLAPNDAWSYAALAEVLSRMGRTEGALAAATQALHLKNEFADDHLGSIGTAYAVSGRYEEARALLQRSLSHYPNILHIHLMLAVVYSELGQAAQARAEAAEVLRLNPRFSLEVHKQRVPIKDSMVLERHIAALRKAGLK